MKVDINIFKLDIITFSIIESFEKNPDMKGAPIKAILLTPKIVNVIGEFIKFKPIIRISW